MYKKGNKLISILNRLIDMYTILKLYFCYNKYCIFSTNTMYLSKEINKIMTVHIVYENKSKTTYDLQI